jgi:hypothetical protein
MSRRVLVGSKVQVRAGEGIVFGKVLSSADDPRKSRGLTALGDPLAHRSFPNSLHDRIFQRLIARVRPRTRSRSGACQRCVLLGIGPPPDDLVLSLKRRASQTDR